MLGAAGLNEAADLRTGKLPGRGDAEENAGEERNAGAEGEDRGVYVDGGFMRERKNGQGGDDPGDTFICGDHAEGGSGDREDHGFGEKLADEAATASAYRDAHGEFVLASGAARQEQDGDIGAADDKKSEDGAEEEDQCAGKLAKNLFVEGDDGGAGVLRIALIVFRELIHDVLEFRSGGGKFHAGLELYKGHPVFVRIGTGNGGQVNVAIAPGKAWRDNADHGVELVVEFDGFADNIAAAAELTLPEQIAQDRDRRGVAVGSVGREEFAAEKRRHAHVFEKIG